MPPSATPAGERPLKLYVPTENDRLDVARSTDVAAPEHCVPAQPAASALPRGLIFDSRAVIASGGKAPATTACVLTGGRWRKRSGMVQRLWPASRSALSSPCSERAQPTPPRRGRRTPT